MNQHEHGRHEEQRGNGRQHETADDRTPQRRVLFGPFAQSQLDQAMSKAVDQIPDAAVLLPAGPISVTNNFLTNIIAVNLAPSDPVKNPKATITPQGVQIVLEIFGQPCSMQGLPQLVNGQLKATNVQVSGMLALFISSDEATTMINRHLSTAQTKLKHSIQSLQLQDGILKSSRLRDESRGSHYKPEFVLPKPKTAKPTDDPEFMAAWKARNDRWLRNSMGSWTPEGPRVEFQELQSLKNPILAPEPRHYD